MAEQEYHQVPKESDASNSSDKEGSQETDSTEYHPTMKNVAVSLEMSELKEEEVQNGHIHHQYYDTETLELFVDVLGLEDTDRCETIMHKKGLTQEEMMRMTSLEFKNIFKDSDISSPKLREIHEKLRTNYEDEEKNPCASPRLSLRVTHSQPRESMFTSKHIKTYFVEIEQFFELTEEENDKLLNEFKQRQYRKILLLDDVCRAFGQNDEKTIIGDILSNSMGIVEVQRQTIYGRIVHGYFKVNDFTTQNIADLSKTIIEELKLTKEIDIERFQKIVKSEKLDGERILNISSATEFVNFFRSMNIQSIHLRKILIRFYKWQNIWFLSPEQLVNCILAICKDSDNKKIICYKDDFRDYFLDNEVDGSKVLKMKRKEFAKDVVKCTGKKRMNGAAGALYSKLQNYYIGKSDYDMPIVADPLSPMQSTRSVLQYQQSSNPPQLLSADSVRVANPHSIAQNIDWNELCKLLNEKGFVMLNESEYDKSKLIDDVCNGWCDEEHGIRTKSNEQKKKNEKDKNNSSTKPRKREINELSKKMRKRMNYSALQMKKIFDIIIHQFIKVFDLNVLQFLKVSKKVIKHLKYENVYIDSKEFEMRSIKNHVYGKKFIEKCKELYPNVKNIHKLFFHYCTDWNVPKEYKVERRRKHTIKKHEMKNTKDALPKYLYKNIFDRSADKNLEKLVDNAVRRVLKCEELWNDPSFLGDIYNDTVYHKAVEKVYESVGKSDFFDDFVKEYAKREFEIWKLNLAEAGKNANSSQEQQGRQPSISRYYVYEKVKDFEYLDEKTNQFEINQLLHYEITDTKIQSGSGNPIFKAFDVDKNDGSKWSVYVPALNRKRRIRYKRASIQVNGYWHLITEGKTPESIQYEEISPKHLTVILNFLQSKWKRNHSKTILETKFGHRLFDENEDAFLIYIEGNRYGLKWWNQKGKNETNTLSIINHTAHTRRMIEYNKNVAKSQRMKAHPPNATLLNYLCHDHLIEDGELEWQWYSNDDAAYERLHSINKPVIYQLEASLLANFPDNFDPIIVDAQFNCAFLSKLTERIEQKYKDKRDYILRVGLSSSRSVSSIEFLSINWERPSISPFSRNAKRLIDGLDYQLDKLSKRKLFNKRWKESYDLYSESQQKFFFCSVLAVAAKIKYIDIEFDNQIVSMLLSKQDKNKQRKQNKKMELVDDRDIRKDITTSYLYEGALIPPDTTWNMLNHAKAPISKADILLENDDKKFILRNASEETELTKYKADFLRFAECARKYALEYESGDTLNTLWPWNKNSFHCADYYHDDANIYNDLLIKHQLSQRSFVKDMANTFEESAENDDDGADVIDDSIRHKRKFAALQLLNKSDIERNLNIIKHQLNLCLSDIVEDAYLNALTNDKTNSAAIASPSSLKKIGSAKADITALINAIEDKVNDILNKPDKSFEIIHRQKWENNQERMLEDITNFDFFWKDRIKKANAAFKRSFDHIDHYKCLSQTLRVIEFIDITKAKLRPFEQFVFELFVETDKENYRKHGEIDSEYRYYKMWIEDWRAVPKWYTYQHDVLLLELVMRNGINVDAIIDNLNGVKQVEYKLRLDHEYDAHASQRGEFEYGNSYFDFKMWCHQKKNILHRLKYVTNVIVRNLQSNEYKPSLIDIRIPDESAADRPIFDGKSIVFSSYERNTHYKPIFIQKYLKKVEKEWNNLDEEDRAKTGENFLTSRLSIINDTDIRNDLKIVTWAKLLNVKIKNKKMKFHINDPFLSRNIDDELLDIFHSFDLMKYGKPLALSIIEQLRWEDKKAYWKVLCTLFQCLPYPIARNIIDESIEFIQDSKTENIKDLCLHLVEGTQFKSSAALGMAEFFQRLAKMDVCQEDMWRKIYTEFEEMAINEMEQIESNHLLYILLTIPMAANKNKSLISIAVEQRRLNFLNSEHIANTMQHQWKSQYLKPSDAIKFDHEKSKWENLFWQVLEKPHEFYLTVRGYYMTQGLSFIFYLAFLYVYAANRPLSANHTEWDRNHYGMEIALWTCNLGYILYEVNECFFEKGTAEYFNFGVMGQTNIWDVSICVTWIVLFVLKACLVFGRVEYEENDIPTTIQTVYVFLFAIQISLMTLRGLSFLKTFKYFGTLIRSIKLMGMEILKFMLIFVVIMVGIVFGLWFIIFTAPDSIVDDPDFEAEDFWKSLVLVFSLFIGVGDFGGIGGQTVAVIFLIIATLLGTLVLTNLLISLMTTKYGQVQERAQKEVLFNSIEKIYDLSNRSRLFPPPLNIIVVIFTIFFWLINLFVSLINPGWNAYGYLNFDLFSRLRQRQYKWGSPLFLSIAFWIAFFVGLWYRNLIVMIIPSILLLVLWIGVYGFNLCSCRSTRTNPELALQNDIKKGFYYYKSLSRGQMFKFYFAPLLRVICKCSCCDLKFVQNVHHKCCYCELKHFRKGNIVNAPIKGISMARYIDEYKIKHNDMNHKDKALVKQLTADILFCEKCYRPFQPKQIEKEAVKPVVPLLDYISTMFFVIIPVIWIPLIVVVGLGALKERITKCLKKYSSENQEYTNQDYDDDYFPKSRHL